MFIDLFKHEEYPFMVKLKIKFILLCRDWLSHCMELEELTLLIMLFDFVL